MIATDVTQNDTARVALLHATRLLDSEPSPAFDALARLVASVMHCPAAGINLVDDDRAWSLARTGLTTPQTTRAGSFCDEVVRQGQGITVTNAIGDPRFQQGTLVDGAEAIRAYAAMPLLVEGHVLGTVFAMDRHERTWSADECSGLQDLATTASALIASQLRAQRFRKMEARVRTASLAGSDWLWESDKDGVIQWVSASLTQHTGIDPCDEVGCIAADLYTQRADATQANWLQALQAQQAHKPFTDAIGDRMTPKGLITVSVSGIPVFDRADQFMGYRGASRNVTRQIAAEREADRADQLLRQAIESFHINVMITDPLGKVIVANSRWKNLTRDVHDPSTAYWPDTLRKLIRQGDIPDGIGREDDYIAWRMSLHEQAHPQEIAFQQSWLLIKDHQLPDKSVVHFAMDITQSKRDAALLLEQQEALAETKARLAAVLGALPDLWFVIDAQGCYLDGHDHHPLLLRPISQLKGTRLGQHLPHPLGLRQQDALSQVQASGQPHFFEYDLAGADGSLRHFAAHMTPMPEGQTLFLARDITQQRQAQQALQLSEERWKFALEGAGDGVWDWDLTTGRVFYSKRWQVMLGYADHDVSGTALDFLDRVHPLDRDPVSQSLALYFDLGEGVHQTELRLQHKQGHYLSILSRGKVVSRHPNGKPQRVVGTHSDITPVKQAERALRDKQSAELANAAKTEFLSRMSHEIRTPLNAVNGFAQLLQMQLKQQHAAPATLNYVDQIMHASRHLISLVNDVLDLQQVEAGIFSVKAEAVSLADEVAQSLSMLAPLAARVGIKLNNRVLANWPLLADRQRLRQVIMNIASNAIKYNQPGGTVRIDAEARADGQLVLTIEDTGPGMSPKQLDKLFQPFERLGRETTHTEGTGLGLIITRSLIEAMGGHMEIRSQLGAGTRVSITLPLVGFAATNASDGARDASEPVACSPTSQAVGLTQAPLRVLYVEDNRINAMLFEEALRPYPQLELRIAEDGQTALSMAQESTPEVLVLDAHLPGMSGFDVLRALRKLTDLASTPAFMCSADAMPDDVARAKEAGFVGYWAKPIDIVAVTTELCRLAARGDNAGL